MTARVRRLNAGFPMHDDERFGFDCPCGLHYSQIPTAGAAGWKFNGDVVNPTFEPSILVRGVVPLTNEQYRQVMDHHAEIAPVPYLCHSYVTMGHIQFLNDCTHHLAGQTVPLKEIT